LALTFDGLSIPGTHDNLQIGSYSRKATREEFFGVRGAAEINGERGPRPIRVQAMWLHNSYANTAALVSALKTLSAKIGTVGTLVELGTVSRSFAQVVLEAVTQEQGPLPSTDLGWFAVITLDFTQLEAEAAS
jgi:hypothetical protein